MTMNKNNLNIYIEIIEKYCTKMKINHRFVGGVSFGGILQEKSTCEIDINKRLITIFNPRDLTLLRSDGTKKDIDLIALSPIDEEKVTQDIFHEINDRRVAFSEGLSGSRKTLILGEGAKDPGLFQGELKHLKIVL